MRQRFALLLAASALQSSAGVFSWHEVHGGQELREDGKPVLVYYSGPQLKEGVAADRRRCCYIYPLYTPGGVSMLDDFPADHPHHRGLFWAWLSIETGGKTYDMWTLKGGMEVRSEKGGYGAGGSRAHFDVENGWFVGDRKVVSERVYAELGASEGSFRELKLKLRLEAVDTPVILRGSHEEKKSYSGLSARFAPREDTVIRTETGVSDQDEDLNRHDWAELEGTYQGRRAALRITPDPGNPASPYQWCLRKYGFVGASFPGKAPGADSYTLHPGIPLELTFTVRVSDVK